MTRHWITIVLAASCYVACSTFPDELSDDATGGTAGIAGSSAGGSSGAAAGGASGGSAAGGGVAGTSAGGSASAGGTGAVGGQAGTGASGGQAGSATGGQAGSGATGGQAGSSTGGSAGAGGTGGSTAGSGGTGGSHVVQLIAPTSTWKYFDKGGLPGANWAAPTFDDTTWSMGQSELGYGDPDVVTIVSFGPNPDDKFVTTYFRKEIDITGNVVGVVAEMKYDDGPIVWIDGSEVFRANLPSTSVSYGTYANTPVASPQEETWQAVPLQASALPPGRHTIAVEMHQANASSSDVSFNFQLTVTYQN